MEYIPTIVWLLLGLWGWYIGKEKNRPVAGTVLGFLLGIIGIVIIMCLKPKPPKLPEQPKEQPKE